MGKVHVGPIVTAGLFYEPDWEKFVMWTNLGHIARRDGGGDDVHDGLDEGPSRRLALMTVSDMIGEEAGDAERISDEEMKRGVDQMMEIGCRVAVS